MKNTFKIISFTLLVLSLGLVLSACGNKNISEPQEDIIGEQNIENQNEDQNQSSPIEVTDDNEVKGIEESDLDVSKWRSYKNEYFNLKFKYHNNWYFQRDNLNQGDYIAVYGFASSSEELNKKEYAIKLYILNKDQDFTEDFSLIKEKEGDNKKYILVANNDEYQDVLNLMEENLEITKKEDKDNIVEMDEFFYKDSEKEFKVNSSELVVRDYFKLEDLVQNAQDCDKDLDQGHFENILGKFSESDIGHYYSFIDVNTQEMGGHYQIIIIPNNLGYSSLEEFNQDFELCKAGAEAYPKAVSQDYLLFENSCGSGMSSPFAEVCASTKDKISPTIKLK